MLEECKRGNHNLYTLVSQGVEIPDCDKITKWCSICGCVLQDIEYDGRIHQRKEYVPTLFKESK
jgi:hypothetical protein